MLAQFNSSLWYHLVHALFNQTNIILPQITSKFLHCLVFGLLLVSHLNWHSISNQYWYSLGNNIENSCKYDGQQVCIVIVPENSPLLAQATMVAWVLTPTAYPENHSAVKPRSNDISHCALCTTYLWQLSLH